MFESSPSKKIIALLGVAFFLGVVLLLLKNLPTRQILKQKATTYRVVTVVVSPATRTLSAGESVDVTVKATAASPVSINATSVSLTYPANLVDISQISCGSVFTALVTTAANGVINLDCYINPNTGTVHQLGAGQSVIIGQFRLTVKANAANGSTINIGVTQAKAIDPIIVANTETDVVGSTAGAVYTVGVHGPITVSLRPSSGNMVKGVDNRFEVVLTSSQLVNFLGGDIKINYDQNKLESVAANGVNPLCAAGLSNNNYINQSQGLIDLICFKLGSTIPVSPTAEYILGSFIIKVKDATAIGSTVTLSFGEAIVSDASQTNYVGQTNPASYTVSSEVQPTATPTPNCGSFTTQASCEPDGQISYCAWYPVHPVTGVICNKCAVRGTPGDVVCPQATATPIPGTVTLAFSIKSQGIFEKRADQKVIVTVKKPSGATGGYMGTYRDINIVSDSTGVYSGSVVLSSPTTASTPVAGDKVWIFIKGPKHLAKKFCVNDQALDKRCKDNEFLVLQAGENTFNWSRSVMEGGDLPLTGGQDGVVNSTDWTFMNGKLGSSVTADLVAADINLDGIVNATDRVLLRITLETKYEEDY